MRLLALSLLLASNLRAANLEVRSAVPLSLGASNPIFLPQLPQIPQFLEKLDPEPSAESLAFAADAAFEPDQPKRSGAAEPVADSYPIPDPSHDVTEEYHRTWNDFRGPNGGPREMARLENYKVV